MAPRSFADRSLDWIHRLILPAWAGAVLFFGAAVAPALFHVLEPAQAGAVVRRLIPVLDAWAIVGAAATVGVGIAIEAERVSRARVVLLVLVALLAGVSLFVVTPAMMNLRIAAADQISALPIDDARRVRFGRLHGVSSALMLVEWIAALASFAFPLRGRSDR